MKLVFLKAKCEDVVWNRLLCVPLVISSHDCLRTSSRLDERVLNVNVDIEHSSLPRSNGPYVYRIKEKGSSWLARILDGSLENRERRPDMPIKRPVSCYTKHPRLSKRMIPGASPN